MKKLNVLLFFSLTLNAICLGVGGHLFAAHVSSSRAAESATNIEAFAEAAPTTLPQSNLTDFRWGDLESTNYLVFIENLRKIECPEQTVDDIVVAEINKLYAPKMKALEDRLVPASKYWQSPLPWSPKLDTAQRALLKEKSTIVKELIGIDLDEYYRRSLSLTNEADESGSYLSNSKLEAIQALQRKYHNLQAQIHEDSHGLITDEDRAALASLQQQQAAEMDALLTPEERVEYDLRNSPASARLARELDAFHPSETEFRTIYESQIAFDKRSQGTNSTSSDVDPQQEFTNQLRTALGEQRFAEYQRSQDSVYQTLLKITDRFGLSQDVTTQVMDLQQSVESQAQQVRAETDLDANQKQAILRDLHDQTASSLSNMLGDSAFGAYQDYGGTWLTRLGN